MASTLSPTDAAADLVAQAYASEARLESDRWRGYDPYDVLLSPLFKLPILRSNRLVRFGSQQVFRRLPINLRPLIRVPIGFNPVTVGLYVQGVAERAGAGIGDFDEAREKARTAVQILADTVRPGYSGACWGYDWIWEARYASMPGHTPTVVATGMITNALYRAYEVFGLETARELIVSSTGFVVKDLHRTPGPNDSFCFSYGPLDHQKVVNATAKGSRLLAQAVALGAPRALLDDAAASMRYVVAAQDEEGRWPYAVADTRGFADVFHTGYNLDALKTYGELADDPSVTPAIERGYPYFRTRFFEPDMTTRYYDDRTNPVDATACAQAVITLCESGDVTAAQAVARRAVELLGMSNGAFAYRRHRWYTNRIHYLRWSTAWMYVALARVAAASRALPGDEAA